MPDNTVRMPRTTEGLRDVLFDEIDAIRCGGSNAARCNAVGRAAETIIDVVRLEMQLVEFDRKTAARGGPHSGLTTNVQVRLGAIEHARN